MGGDGVTQNVLVSNLQRSGLSPEDQAEVYMRWCLCKEMSIEHVGACVGITRQGAGYAYKRAMGKVGLRIAPMVAMWERMR